jgi:hypothetical protein
MCDLAEMFLIRGIVFSHEAVRDWETKLTPALVEELRRRHRIGPSWYADDGASELVRLPRFKLYAPLAFVAGREVRGPWTMKL